MNEPMTPRAKLALANATRLAQERGHNWVGTEHLLAGLLAIPEGAHRLMLIKMELDPDKCRESAWRALSFVSPPKVGKHTVIANRLRAMADELDATNDP